MNITQNDKKTSVLQCSRLLYSKPNTYYACCPIDLDGDCMRNEYYTNDKKNVSFAVFSIVIVQLANGRWRRTHVVCSDMHFTATCPMLKYHSGHC